MQNHAKYSDSEQEIPYKSFAAATRSHGGGHILHNALFQGPYTDGVKLSFSLAIIAPVLCLLLCWFIVFGSRAYIRKTVNNPENFPTIAAIYWIGQTFAVYVIAMDGLALWHNTSVSLPTDHYGIVLTTLILEIVTLIAYVCVSILFLIFNYCACCTHFCTHFFRKMFNCTCIFCGADINANEARVWWCLGGLIPTILCASSHTGYIIAGWISHIENSIAITLFYLFVFIFLFWSFQHAYTFSVRCVRFFKKYCKRYSKKYCTMWCKRFRKEERYKKNYYRSNGCCNIPYHFNSDWTKYSDKLKRSDFHTTALCFMVLAVLIIDGILLYIGYAIFLPSLVSIHVALSRIYNIGQYIFSFAVFLLTYKLFAGDIGSATQGIFSDKTLKVWRFLNRGTHPNHKHPVETLQLAMKYLLVTAKIFKRDACTSHEDKQECLQLKRKELDMVKKYFICEVYVNPIGNHSENASENDYDPQNPRANGHNSENPGGNINNPGSPRDNLLMLHLKFSAALDHLIKEDVKAPITAADITAFLNDIEDAGITITTEVEGDTYTHITENDLNMLHKYVKRLCKGVKHLQKTIQSILRDIYIKDEGIPPIYLNSEKLNALFAALIFQKTNTAPLADNEHYSLLMSLIDEEL